MKKFFTAILAILYISTSTGATLHMHYCMGKLANWGLIDNTSKTCSKCGMETSEKKDNNCCRDEKKFIKNNTDQKAAETVFQLVQVMSAVIPVSFFETPSAGITTITEESTLSHAPPQNKSIAVYIRNCVFLI